MEKSSLSLSSSSSSSSLDRKSSIEREPLTINMDFAREQAVYVVNTRSVEEALAIFTKGLQPVTCCERDKATNMDDEQQQLDCLPTCDPDFFEFRKIASAPF